MILFTTVETEYRAKVASIHYKPELLQAEVLAKGILVDAVPEEPKQEGKTQVLYINPTTEEMWYEYIDKPLSSEERLENRLSLLEDKINLILENLA